MTVQRRLRTKYDQESLQPKYIHAWYNKFEENVCLSVGITRIVLTVGGYWCYFVQNCRCIVTTDSHITNCIPQIALLAPVDSMFYKLL